MVKSLFYYSDGIMYIHTLVVHNRLDLLIILKSMQYSPSVHVMGQRIRKA